MAVYYISNNGCDKNNGLTPETAWATIDHANQNISGGDQILLRCGDIFYGKITLPEGTAENPTVISSYGVGERPQICMYKITTSPEIWTEVQPNIWRTSLLDKANYTGNMYTDDTNVGFIMADGEIHGFRKFEFPDLSVQWDYLCENEFIYVFSEGNPNSLKREIRFSVNGYVITPMGHNIISNLDLCGSGGHGIAGIYHNVQILNCRIHEVGGSILVGYSNPRTRYGNGIEIWQDTENVTIDNCHIINCYDVAFTMQGYPEKGGWSRVSLKNCVMWGNHQSFEIWSRIKKIDGGMFECEFMNNVCIGAGMGWSDGPRPNKDCGAHLLFYATDCSTHDIKVKNLNNQLQIHTK